MWYVPAQVLYWSGKCYGREICYFCNERIFKTEVTFKFLWDSIRSASLNSSNFYFYFINNRSIYLYNSHYSIPTLASISCTRLCRASNFYAIVLVSTLSVRTCCYSLCVSVFCVFLLLSISLRTLVSSFCTDFLVSWIFIVSTDSSVSFSERTMPTWERWYLISVNMSLSLFYYSFTGSLTYL